MDGEIRQDLFMFGPRLAKSHMVNLVPELRLMPILNKIERVLSKTPCSWHGENRWLVTIVEDQANIYPKKELEKMKKLRPIIESDSWEIGYVWAKRQQDLSGFEEFYDEWNESMLSQERISKLFKIADVDIILNEAGWRYSLISEKTENGDYLSSGDVPADNYFDKNLIYHEVLWGIMGRLKEVKNIDVEDNSTPKPRILYKRRIRLEEE